jgi:redox-sensing transcriptional repressor
MNFPAQVPTPSVRRLSLYLRQLEVLEGDSVVTVSSRKFAQSLGITDAQVRKDLAYFGQFGQPGVGYEVMPLIHRLRNIFGTDHLSLILLVGVGNLGKAATAYQAFRTKGFELVAVFDNDPEMIGRRFAHLSVLPMADLPQAASEYDAHLAIIAVPAAVAQNVADRLIAAGVRGILNFAPTRLNMPPGVTVRNIDVTAELEQLNFQTNMGLPWSARGFTPPESSDLVTKTTECIPQEAVVQVI